MICRRIIHKKSCEPIADSPAAHANPGNGAVPRLFGGGDAQQLDAPRRWSYLRMGVRMLTLK